MPTPLPAAAASWRTDLLVLVAAVAAHSAAPPSGALWAPPPRGRARPAPAAPAPDARAAAADCPAHQEQALSHTGGGLPAALTWRRLLSAPAAVTQRELSLHAHAAWRVRLFAGLSGWARTGLAAVQGRRAVLWLIAVPFDRGGRGHIPGSAMRVAARLWLGAPPRPDPPRPRCACGASADPAGRHFLSACRAQVARRTAVHHHIEALVAAALRRAPAWREVVVEAGLDGTGGDLRPDLRATAAATAAVTWGDVSVAWPWPDAVAARVRTSPLLAVAAAEREAAKRAAYMPALPTTDPPHVFTPLVCDALGRVGTATNAWLKAALAGPQLAADRARLLLDVSVALGGSLTWAVAGGYIACSTTEGAVNAIADLRSTSADAMAWRGGDFSVLHF